MARDPALPTRAARALLACALCATTLPGADVALPPAQPAVQFLTLSDARAQAVHNHPRISMAELDTLVAAEETRIARSAYLPAVAAYGTVVRASQDNTRIAAGGINNPSVFDREAVGLAATQLITDFGRTGSLIDTARLHAEAQAQDAVAVRREVLLEVDLAFFRALKCQAMLLVADETLHTRQLLVDRVEGMVANKLKSELDASFAKVDLEEAQILKASLANQQETAQLELQTLIGRADAVPLALAEEPIPPLPAGKPDAFVTTALAHDPRIARLRLELDAARRSRDASDDLDYPTLSAMGVAGVTADHDPRLADTYLAGGLNLSIPLYTGHLISSRQQQAELRVRRANEQLRQALLEVPRQVRIAFSDLGYAHERLDLTAKLLAQATQALELAQARYDLGTTSVIEISQAQLAKTQAEISQSGAKEDYLGRLAVFTFALGADQTLDGTPARAPAGN